MTSTFTCPSNLPFPGWVKPSLRTLSADNAQIHRRCQDQGYVPTCLISRRTHCKLWNLVWLLLLEQSTSLTLLNDDIHSLGKQFFADVCHNPEDLTLSKLHQELKVHGQYEVLVALPSKRNWGRFLHLQRLLRNWNLLHLLRLWIHTSQKQQLQAAERWSVIFILEWWKMSKYATYLILLFNSDDVAVISHCIRIWSDGVLKDLLFLWNCQLCSPMLKYSEVSLDLPSNERWEGNLARAVVVSENCS